MNFSNKTTANCKQIITIFSEEEWQKSQQNFPSTVGDFFSGKSGEFFVHNTQEQVYFLIGIGQDYHNADIQQVAQKFSNQYRKNIQPVFTKINAQFLQIHQIESFVKGLFVGTYTYPFSKHNHPFWHQDFLLICENITSKDVKKIELNTNAICEGQFAAMDWLNKPANEKKTNRISEYLKEISIKYNFKYTSYNRSECEKLGLGAFVAVNQGSSTDCSFAIIEYTSPKKNAKTIGLVGKCVLFDTGGISLKNPDNMHYMKSDLGGATAVFGTLIAAAKLNLPVNIIAILPITDNLISENAYLPSDVVTAYNGKTIEVLNTDAEGRMTLADGLAYLSKNYTVDYLVDLATLTGSAVRMFGDTCGALFSNSEVLKNKLLNAGNTTNQKLWELPLWDIWKNEIQSDVADFKNISLKPIGDCIVAAKFLEQFINQHPNWAHLDIAGVSFGNVQYAKEKAATGYGVELLINFMQNLS